MKETKGPEARNICLDVKDQSWHDGRYKRAREAGLPHSSAWAMEKRRRRAAAHRLATRSERVQERQHLEQKWHDKFDARQVKEEEYEDK